MRQVLLYLLSLDTELFPIYVQDPVNNWFLLCEAGYTDTDFYSEEFLTSFEECDFFQTCKTSLNGKLIWDDWQKCSQKCSDDGSCGVRIRIASACIPNYATCKDLQDSKLPRTSSLSSLFLLLYTKLSFFY